MTCTTFPHAVATIVELHLNPKCGSANQRPTEVDELQLPGSLPVADWHSWELEFSHFWTATIPYSCIKKSQYSLDFLFHAGQDYTTFKYQNYKLQYGSYPLFFHDKINKMWFRNT